MNYCNIVIYYMNDYILCNHLITFYYIQHLLKYFKINLNFEYLLKLIRIKINSLYQH